MKKWLEKFAMLLAKTEVGGKTQMNAGQARKVTKVLSRIFFEYDGGEMATILATNGKRIFDEETKLAIKKAKAKQKGKK